VGQGIVFGGLNSANSNIKSIQFVSVASGTPGTATISSVDVNKAVPIALGEQGGDCIAEITDATTLSVHSYSGAITTYWMVIEFRNVKSLQVVKTSLYGGDPLDDPLPAETTKDTTISSVSTTRTALFPSGAVTGAVRYASWVSLQNATTVRVHLPASIVESTNYFNVYVVEFTSA